MATWNDVKGHINSNYKIQEDKGESITMTWSWDDGRSQFVIITSEKTNSGVEWVQICSPVGKLKKAGALDNVLEELFEKICGGLVKIGEKYYVRHCMPIADLSAEEFDDPLKVVVGVADTLEEKFEGGDEN